MTENLRWFTKALYGFDHVVRSTAPDRWDRPSPCAGWTARHVAGHVIAIQRYIEACIEARPPTMNPMVDPHLHAGPDPGAAWAAVRDDVLEALDHEGVLRRVVPTFHGEEPVDDLIGFNVVDTTVHTWDLARAVGADDRLDPGLIERSIVLIEPRADQMRAPMVFGPPVVVADRSDRQAVLLGIVGRRT